MATTKKTTAKTTQKKTATTKTNSCKKTTVKKVKTLPQITIEKKRSIMFAASECAPFIATGGLADVAGSLPKALANNLGLDVSVVLPLYSKISDTFKNQMEYVTNFTVSLSWRNLYCGVFRLVKDGVTYYFIDNEYYFKREGNIYGFYDDGERYAFFSKAVLDLIGNLNVFPDVLNLNDWQTASTVIYLRSLYNYSEDYRKIKTVFTIHNIEYQGKYGTDTYGDLFGFPGDIFDKVEFQGCINLMKGAIEMADAVNTVSPTYAEEIKNAYFAHGLEGEIGRNANKVRGILNGIDTDYYNPETDKYLFKNYNKADLSGKAVCKAELQKMLSLPVREDVPVIAVISRLVGHKGVDLIKEIFDSLMSEDVQFVILGTGDSAYENYFKAKASDYQNKCVFVCAFNPDLSRKIYSGSDIFLMPSKTEPCGLSQMIAARYGTVSVVRETGGLNDSIKAYTGDNGNGFTFKNYNAHDMLYVINEAIRAFKDKKVWADVLNRAITSDFSWKASAVKYAEMYDYLCK